MKTIAAASVALMFAAGAWLAGIFAGGLGEALRSVGL